MSTPFDPKAWAETAATALGLPLAPEDRADIEANLAIAFALAADLLAFALPDELEQASMFDPEAPA